jgi:hypothetical protein
VLFVENDTNSLGYNQWFYFSIQNNEANRNYTFRLVNMVNHPLLQRKRRSFFEAGCKPAVFSLEEARVGGAGWSRMGSNISYE